MSCASSPMARVASGWCGPLPSRPTKTGSSSIATSTWMICASTKRRRCAVLPDPDPFSLAPCSLCQGRFAPAAPMPPHSRAASLTAAARGALPEAGRDEGIVLPIEQRDVVIDLSKPVPVSMTNLLNLTHATLDGRLRELSCWHLLLSRVTGG